MSTTSCRLDTKEFPIPTFPDQPKLRIGTQLDAVYTRLLRSGHGFANPRLRPGKPVVVVVFDPCCAWCHHFWDAMFGLRDQIDFRWYPVCVSRDMSTALGAQILSADEPWEAMADHQEEFEDYEDRADVRGSQAARDMVWENARLFRKSGGTSVPLAIYKDKVGNYRAFLAEDSVSEVLKAVG